jgi:hypothetical protein
MGFLNFWKEQPKTDQFQEKLLKLEGSGEITLDATEPGRQLAHGLLRREIERRDGGRRTFVAIHKAADEIMLGEHTEDLYRSLGLHKGSRANLPWPAKQALMTGDIAAYHQIMQEDAQGHYPVVQAAKKGYLKARALFPW